MAIAKTDGVNLGQCQVITATDKAIKVQLESEDGSRWIPKSQIHDDSEAFDADKNATGDLVVTRWFADKEGLA
jgi:hypothetical protein